MYLEHFSLKERPFSISPDPRYLFMSNRYREALAHLTYGVEDGGGFVLLTGEVGTGKTTVCRCLLQQLPKNTRLAFVLNPKLNSLELLATICDELSIEYPENCTSLKTLTDNLSEYLLKCYQQDLSVVVMIDEAQNIETEVLEQIRLLTNLETNQKKLLQIILVGQPELQEKLAKRELRQLAQRITARYHLRPLNLRETMAYVLHRVRVGGGKKSLFNRKAIELLHEKTLGIPRLVNTICDRALVASCSRKQYQVDQKIMREAIADVMGNTAHSDEYSDTSGWSLSAKIFLGLAMLSVLVLVFWLGQQSREISLDESPLQPTKNNVERPPEQTLNTNSPDNQTEQNVSKSLVDDLLGSERWDNNGHWSMKQLLNLWKIDYSLFSNGPGCEYAENYGLICYRTTGNWQQLIKLDRPAILRFSAGLQGDFWGVLSRIDGSQATLQFGERVVKTGIAELSSIWTGEFQILWQAPVDFSVDLKLGDRGKTVLWLKEKISAILNTQSSSDDIFDLSLKNALSQYQIQRGISADGIAGMQTILMINRDTLNGIPLLQD